jgi:hypothetical protein
LAQPKTAVEVTQADIDKLRALLDEFRGDIDSLKLKVADIDTRLKKVEATQDRAQLHAVYFIRAGSFSEQTAAYSNAYNAATPGSCPGVPASKCGPALAAGSPLTGGSLGAGDNMTANKYYSGQNQAGYGYQLLRLLLDGNLDKTTSYHIRIENRYFWDTPNAQLSSSATPGGTVNNVPNYLTSTTSLFDYPANSSVRLNYAYMQYNDPSGLFAEAGRINETNGTLGMAWADQFNGAEVGYKKGPFALRGLYAFQWPQYNSGGQTTTCTYPATSTTCGYDTQTLLGEISFAPTKQSQIGFSYVTDINDRISDWNPSVCSTTGKAPTVTNGSGQFVCPAYVAPTGAPAAPLVTGATGTFQNVLTNIAEGAVWGKYADKVANVPVLVEAEGDYRFGNNPITGASWQQPWAVWVQGKIGAYSPTAYRAYLEGGYIGAGYNSIGPHTSLVNGTSYDGQYQGNPNGYRFGYVGLHYWFSQYGRVGVVYQGYDILPGIAIPVVSPIYAGTYLTHDIGQAVFLQTWLQF